MGFLNLIPFSIAIPQSAAEGNGVLSGQGLVRVDVAPSVDLTVSLSSGDTSEVTLPASVTILAGQTSASFDLTIVDDAWLDGSQTVTISASAAGFGSSTAMITVHDNETATLSVDVPLSASEGDGLLSGQGTVTVSTPVDEDVTVFLSSDDTGEVAVPETMIIPAGQTSATFDLTIIDDNEIDGDQVATITASVAGWTGASGLVRVQDNETLNLTVTIPDSAIEGDGQVSVASVSIAGTYPLDLVVNLTSDDTSEITVPDTVTIPAGQTSAAFSLTIIDDAQVDGDQTVTVTASAAGWVSGSDTIVVVDSGPGILQFSTATYLGDENSGRIDVTVLRTRGTIGTVAVDYQVSDGTAESGVDYTAAAGTLTFTEGEESKTFTVKIFNDLYAEGIETINVSLANPVGGAALGSPGTAVLAIVENAERPAIAAGREQSIMLDTDGSVWIWGRDFPDLYGGEGGPTYHTIPVQKSNLSAVIAIAGGSDHTITLKSDGTVWSWGDNDFGQLGDGRRDESPDPVQASNLTDVVAIAAGEFHSLALRSDGTVWAWGVDYSIQPGGEEWFYFNTTPTQVLNLTDVMAIAGGDHHSLALKSDGTAWAWGANDRGQLGDGTMTDSSTPVQVSGLTDIVAVAGGSYHSIALKSDGTVWTWGGIGDGEYGGGELKEGEFGDGEVVDGAAPVQISNLTDVVAIAGGYSHSIALKSDGTVWAWGAGYSIPPNDGEWVYFDTTLTQVFNLTDVVAISGGGNHNLAFKSDGTVWAWGGNWAGQLGNGAYELSPIPVQVHGQDDGEYLVLTPPAEDTTPPELLSAAPVDGSTLKIVNRIVITLYDNDGIVDDDAVIGSIVVTTGGGTVPGTVTESSDKFIFTPAARPLAEGAYDVSLTAKDMAGNTRADTFSFVVNSLTGLPATSEPPAIAAGAYHSIGLNSDGTVWSWGRNEAGQLGDGTTTPRTSPVQASNLSDVIAIAGGYAHTIALKSDGTAWSWGYNEYGQLGDGTTEYRTTPGPVSDLTDAIAIAGGYAHSLALKSDGTVWSWGYNDEGQLGDGTTEYRTTPVQVSALTDVIAIAGGYSHSLALKSDGTIWSWGYNYDGRLGDGTTTTRTTPVQVSNLTGVVAVAGGYYHSLALKSDGTVWAWGEGDGPVPVQVSSLTGVVAIAGGDYHSLALKSDGTVWAWGGNWYGQLGDGTTMSQSVPVQVSYLTDMIAIAGGSVHSMAFQSDGTVWAWGNNGYGQIGDGTNYQRVFPMHVHGPGNVGYLDLIFVVEDTTPPALQSTAPVDGSVSAIVNQIAITLHDAEGEVDDAAVIAGIAVRDGSSNLVSGAVTESNDVFTFDPAAKPMAAGTYTVTLTATDDSGNSQAYSFSFIVDGPPNIPSAPNPAHEAVEVTLSSGSAALSWTGGDPTPTDPLVYDVYFGTEAGSLTKVADGISAATYSKTALTPGTHYYWQIVSRDSFGHETSGPVWQFTTFRPDLVVTDLSWTPAINIEAGHVVTFTAVVQNSGNCPVAIPFYVEFMIDGTGIGAQTVSQAIAAGGSVQVSQTWAGLTGIHTVQASADSGAAVNEIDESNNGRAAIMPVIADTTPPALQSTSPADGALLQQGEQIVITLSESYGSVNDAAVIGSIAVVNGSGSVGGTVTESNDAFTFMPAGGSLPGGTYTVTLTATDDAGNAQAYGFSFIVDTLPSIPSNPDPAHEAVEVPMSGDAVTLSWTGIDSDPNDVLVYDVYFGATEAGITKVADSLSATTFSKNALSPGTRYYWKVIARDARGQETAGSLWQFTTYKPDLVVTGISWEPAPATEAGQEVTFTAVVQNNSTCPVADPFQVQFFIDGVGIGVQTVSQTIAAGDSVVVNQTWSTVIGIHTIQATADSGAAIDETDESNNADSETMPDILDTTAPALQSTAPAVGDVLLQVDQIVFALSESYGSVDDAAVIGSIAVTNGGAGVSGEVTESNDVFTFSPTPSPLDAGTYTVTLTAWDDSGNSQVYSFSFTVDGPPNIPSAPNPAHEAVEVPLSSGSVVLSWTGGDLTPTDTVVYDVYFGTAAGSLFKIADSISTSTYSKGDLTQGTKYFWQIVARDSFGHEKGGPVWEFAAFKPDLVVTDLSWTPAVDIEAGHEVVFTAVVKNNSSCPVEVPFQVDFSIDGLSIGTTTVSQPIDAGASAQVTKTWASQLGLFTIQATADVYGAVNEVNETNNSRMVTMPEIRDTTPPALLSTSPADGAVLQDVEQIVITLSESFGSVDDAAVIGSIAVTTGGAGVSGEVTEANDVFTFNPVSKPLDTGTYTVTLTAWDNSGNSQAYSFSFIVDGPPNIPSAPDPAHEAVEVPLSGGSVVLSWTGGDPTPTDTVVYDVYFGTEAVSLSKVADSISATTFSKSDLSQGTRYYWQSVARDSYGQESTGPVWEFTAFKPDLVVTDLTWTPAADIEAGQAVTFTAVVQNSGNCPVEVPFDIEFLIDGAGIGTQTVSQTIAAGGSVQLTQAWASVTGIHTIQATADSGAAVNEIDESNNALTATLPGILDTTPPALQSTNPADGALLQQANQIVVTLSESYGSVDDAAVIGSIAVTNGGAAVSGAVIESDDVFTFTPAGGSLSGGTYTVALTAKDNAGNTQAYSFSFVVDTLPNTPSAPQPAHEAADVPLTGGAVTLSWTGGDSDPNDVLVYDLYFGTTEAGIARIADSLGTMNYSKGDLTKGGTYYWRVVARDARGQETSGPVWQFTAFKPDLVVTDIAWTPNPATEAGQEITFTAVIQNNSTCPVEVPFQVEFLIDGAGIGAQPVSQTVAAGGSVQVSQTWTSLIGIHTIQATADSGAVVDEIDESNNIRQAAMPEILDVVPPVLIGTVPASGAVLKEASLVTFTLSDAHGSIDTAAVIDSFVITRGIDVAVPGAVTADGGTFTFTPTVP
ncbi:MAG: CARDB domain-containing protein, partial [Pseudomonadota bacterium]